MGLRLSGSFQQRCRLAKHRYVMPQHPPIAFKLGGASLQALKNDFYIADFDILATRFVHASATVQQKQKRSERPGPALSEKNA